MKGKRIVAIIIPIAVAFFLIFTFWGTGYSYSQINIQPEDDQKNPKKKVMVMGVDEISLKHLSPSNALTQDDFDILTNTRQGLFSAKDNSLILNGVRKIEVHNGCTRFEFKLEPTKWSNGETVTSYDYIKAWNRLTKEDLNGADIKSFSALDSETILIITNRKTSDLYNHLTNPKFFPQYYSGEVEDINSIDPSKTVTNGPFKLSYYGKDKVYFEKNIFFKDADSITLNGIECRFIDKVKLAVDNSSNRNIDFSDDVDGVSSQEAFLSNKNIFISPSNKIAIAVLSTESGILKSHDVRTALKTSITRSSFEDSVLPGQEIARVLMPFKLYRSSLIYSSSTEDVIGNSEISKIEKAVKLLRRSGITNKTVIKIAGLDDGNSIRYMSILKLIWENNLGIKIETRELNPMEFKNAKKKKLYDVYIEDVEWSCLNNRGLYDLVRQINPVLGYDYKTADQMTIELIRGLISMDNIIIPLMYSSNYVYLNTDARGWYVDQWSYYHFSNVYFD